MAIATADGYIGAAKQKIRWLKTAARTTVAAQWFSLLDIAGNPGAGSLSVGNTANGVVPTDATAGYPVVNAFGGGSTGYLSIVDFSSTVACRFALHDRLFNSGSHSTAALGTTTLTSQPSFASRVPGGADFANTEIWLEVQTQLAAASTISVTYTNQSGTGSRSTGATASLSGFTVGRLVPMPLQAGDTGVQRIDGVVVGGTAGAGAVNVVVARPLWTAGRVGAANAGDVHGLDKTGLPVVFADSALWPVVATDSTSSGVPDMLLEVVNG